MSSKAYFPVALTVLAACVPTGSAPPYDAGPTPAVTTTFKPSAGVMMEAFEDTFDRPDAGPPGKDTELLGDAATTPTAAIDAALKDDGATSEAGPTLAIADAGVRPKIGNLGPNWDQMRTSAWKVENGKLCGEGAHNHGIWLNKVLPVNARIEFDATSFSDEGDLKAEVWGDGKTYATGTSYTNATSYLAILGGWKNTLQVLARLNEHGTDRREIHIDNTSDDPRQRSVERGQVYKFKIERTDGKTIRWSVNDVEYLTWADAAPLAGQGHDHFGFNEWEVKVCFDNVKVTPL